VGSARIAVVGDFDPGYQVHQATNAALQLAVATSQGNVEWEWVATDAVVPGDPGVLTEIAGVWMAPGGPYRSLDGALWAIRCARERGLPFLGT
jgi:CTP synthase (UTP-ammonia lyase)